ncbi:zinc finger protein 625-like isoform X3 [Haliotis rubra]|uniref:zinc finger protein 625-like isoform X3 n=1 Tax=Haliotis rubra TaxID=36100 RepID=UPI001EE62EB1|nr:zinc finger protein 625-like isoform X3 [Haliotis rubra]
MCQITPNPVLVKFIMVTKVQMTFLVFQEQDDNDCDNDNDADFDNEDEEPQTIISRAGGHVSVDLEWNLNRHLRESRFGDPPTQVPSGQMPKTVHTSTPGDSIDQGTLPFRRRYKCPFCEKSFFEMQSVRVHKASVHDNVSYTCECGKTFGYQNSLQRHKKYSCNLTK